MACIICCSCTGQSGSVHLKGQIDLPESDRIMHYDGALSMLGQSRDIVLHTDE